MMHNQWHRFVTMFLRILAGPAVKRVMRYKCKKYKGPEAPSLIIANHNTDLDPALVSLGFTRQLYYTASEHSFRNGFPSKVMKFAFAPIPINKTKTDIASIKEMIRRLKAGASVCLFAEGDRSFTGTTARISISTAKLAKASKADLITFRLEGGYFTSPRWSRSLRKGRMSGGVVNRYPAAELRKMTDEQILEAIKRDVFEDAYERQKAAPVNYRGKNLAEHIETTLYLCPCCKELGTIRSEGDHFSCGCGLKATYTQTGYLEGGALPFTTITQWCGWQKQELEEIVNRPGDGPICSDENQRLYEVRPAVDKKLLGEGTLQIDREALRCAGMTFPLSQIEKLVVAGKMTMLFSSSVNGTTYEVRSPTPRSALKYKEIFRVLRPRD